MACWAYNGHVIFAHCFEALARLRLATRQKLQKPPHEACEAWKVAGMMFSQPSNSSTPAALVSSLEALGLLLQLLAIPWCSLALKWPGDFVEVLRSLPCVLTAEERRARFFCWIGREVA